ncbi:hypothetical protein [Cryptosporangium phraense]|uniref:Uncharacterized protein n=1 Tax=Cryptosporangium phraense TaxID=2593070 RepID=A0A545AS81_9ACTN|nr:hypothetical protein [Cryptosporangium phraense]TQS44190.1 hypothetical protein FL583_14675 [Cryptosporangium phraense]
MTYPQDPQGYGQQQPGAYDPSGAGYGDPYAQPGSYQPAYDPTTGQPLPPGQVPPGQVPPGQVPPGSPLTPGYDYNQPQYPQQPTSGYPGAPTSGYPGYQQPAYPQPGYQQPAYPQPGYGYPPVPPPKKSNTGLILGIVAGVVVLLVVVVSLGLWAISGDDPPTPKPTIAAPSPSVSTSPSPSDPPLLSQFKDPDLRDFARHGTATATTCEVVTSTIPGANAANEALKCSYTGSFEVYYLRYKTLADRDSYAKSARNGFSDDTLVVDGDTFWTDDQQTRQGNYITGHATKDGGRYIYWDVPGKPVSGEIYTTTTDAAATEAFWKKIR